MGVGNDVLVSLCPLMLLNLIGEVHVNTPWESERKAAAGGWVLGCI